MRSSSILHLLFLFFSLSAQAEYKNINEILASPHRPSMIEVLPFLNEIEEGKNIPVRAEHVANYFDKRIDITKWLRILLETSPRMIATAEQLYPGAKWIFLGRDAMAISDVFEAYYHSIGEKNRVIRLGVSKASFHHLSEKDLRNQFGAYFKQHGFTWEKAHKLPPYILIDAISGGYGRQGRAILAAMYSQGQAEKKSPLFMADRLNMIGLRVSTYSHPLLYDTTQADYYVKREKWLWVAGKILNYAQFFNLKALLTYQAESDHTHNEAGYTHYIGAWHESYGGFSTLGAAAVGASYPIEMKQSILWTQKKIWEAVKSNVFIEEVRRQKELVAETTKKVPTLSPKQIKEIEELLNAVPENGDVKSVAMNILNQIARTKNMDFDIQSLAEDLNKTKPTDVFLAQIIGFMQNNAYALDYFIRFLDRAMLEKKMSVEKGSALELFLKIHKMLGDGPCDEYLQELE